MSTVANSSATNPFAALGVATGGAVKAASAADATEDRFLALLVSQLKNQDPLNPLDNNQMTSQLAQINTVKGIEQLNQTLGKLVGRMDSSDSLQAAATVGKRVLVPGSGIQLAAGEALGGFELASGADAVTITVRDGSGRALHTADLGAQGAGLHLFAWDGVTDSGAPAVDGTYAFEVAATLAGKAAPANTLAVGVVNGVIPGANGVKFNVNGLAPVALSDIRQILN